MSESYSSPEINTPQYVPPHDGIHISLYAFSCRCAESGLSKQEARERIDDGLKRHAARRNPDNREIQEAIDYAYADLLGVGPKSSKPPKWPRIDEKAIRAVYEKRKLSVETLRALSPQTPPTDPKSALKELFLDGELICLGRSVRHSIVRLKEEWLQKPSISEFQFVVPHPMTATHGLTKYEKKSSSRTKSNTGPRRWVICEFDNPPLEWQPSLIAELADIARCNPALILHSGNKSLHAWFAINGASKEAVRFFEERAAILGADKALLGDAKRAQMVRLPAATRDNGTPQQVLYWNPEVCIDLKEGGATC